MTHRGPVASSLIALLLLGGCSSVLGTNDPDRGDVGCCQAPDGLELEYLGTGGWTIEWQGSMVLTAPYYTNAGIGTTLIRAMRSDTQTVARNLPNVSGAEAILVGHSHFDHLLDVPYVARVGAPTATVYGSWTTRNLLAGDPGIDPARVVAVNDNAGTSTTPGRWHMTAGGRVRIMALEAGHAPHFQGLELYQGFVDEPLGSLPTRPEDWVGGRAYAYLIDFLDANGDVAFRVHYQDAAASAPLGHIPDLPPADRAPVDVVILCAPSFSEVEGFPEGIIRNAHPRVTFLGHWEDFLKPLSPKPRSVPLTNLAEFQRRLKRVLPPGANWRLPRRSERFTIARR